VQPPIRARGPRHDHGAGTVEYVGIMLGAVAIVLAVIMAAGGAGVGPSLGQTLVCKLTGAVSSLTGGDVPDCTMGDPADGTSTAAVTVTTPPSDSNSAVVVHVDAPPGVTWWLDTSDPYATPYVTPTAAGPGDATIWFPANPGQARTTQVTVHLSDGTTKTISVTRPGGVQNLVAVGDSYMAGPGAEVDHPETPFTVPLDNSPNAEDCWRAPDAYPRLLGSGSIAGSSGVTPTLSVSTNGFAACNGATVTGGDGRGGLQRQLKDLSDQGELDDADIMLLSIGGNDIGFADVVKAMIADIDSGPLRGKLWSNAEGAVNDARGKIAGADAAELGLPVAKQSDWLAPKLDEAYRQALDATQDAGTTIYVIGYPPVVAADDPQYTVGMVPHNEEVPMAARLIDELNSKIQERVDAANAAEVAAGRPPRMVYVSLTEPDSPFVGHGITTDDPYFVTVSQSIPNAPFPKTPFTGAYHPNDNGTHAQGEVVVDYLLGDR